VKSQITQEALATVAKHIAERCNVVYKDSTVPCADPQTGDIFLPKLATAFTGDDLMRSRCFTYHEALHIDLSKHLRSPGVLGHIENALEDCRIEREGSSRMDYAGSVFGIDVCRKDANSCLAFVR